MKQTHLQELVMPWFESMPDATLVSALTATAIGVGSNQGITNSCR